MPACEDSSQSTGEGRVAFRDPGRPLRFEVFDQVDPEQWQAIADASPYATFFHTPAWLSAFARSDPAARIATRIYRFEDGKTAVFPLLERKRFGGLGATVESCAATCYGGWVSGDGLTPDHARAITQSVLRRSRNLVWRVNPFDPLTSALDSLATVHDSSEVLDLEGFADDAALRAHFRHSVRKQVNKACRVGLSARVADRWEEWEEYYRIYEIRLRQWGDGVTSRYSLAFFRTLWEARGSKVILWVVIRDGKIAGGNVNFYQGRHCVEWHAAYDCSLFSCGVRDFLVDHVIRDARARGFAWYDFNPSGGHEGSRRFKQTFGTTSRPSNLILVRRGIYRLESARRAFRVLRELPGR